MTQENHRPTRSQAGTLLFIACVLIIIPLTLEGEADRIYPFFVLAIYMAAEAAYIAITTRRGEWYYLNVAMFLARSSVVVYAALLFLSFGGLWAVPARMFDASRWALAIGCTLGVIAVMFNLMRWFGERRRAIQNAKSNERTGLP